MQFSNRVFVLAVVTDITERKKAEHELRKTRNYLDNVINSMPSIVIGIDPEGSITHWNNAAEKETGIISEQAKGRSLVDMFPNYSKYIDEMKQTMKDRKFITKEKIQKQDNGGIHYQDMLIYPLVSNGIEGAILRIDDITEKVRLEKMMIQTEKMMSVGALAAGMAHEINNPLGVILLGIQNTFRRLSPELEKNLEVAEECGIELECVSIYLEKRGIKRYLNGIFDAGERAAKIVDNMLNFSRSSEAEMKPTDINELLNTSIELAASDYNLKKKYDFRHIKIIRNYDNELCAILCSRTEIEQVILNLLKNAAQAMSEVEEKNYMPQISIRTRKKQEYAVIEISDNGAGMDEKVLKHIFEPFYTTKGAGVGTGLGLSVSYFIICDNHNGKIDVESEPGKGTKFTIHLPME